EASCHQKICLSHPPVSQAGERVICAPNNFLLEIQGTGLVDTVIG
ncbi:MAG: NusG domain II-containing protein, partial [Candidatus Aminicenantes bacterium]